jgi:hypothetical protein
MQISHENARKLIQFDADQALKDFEKRLLADHLAVCLECSEYARRVQELELTLTSVMQKRWNKQTLPLSPQVFNAKEKPKFIQSFLFATRIIAMGVICIAFLFNIWQFTQSGGRGSPVPAASIPPVPTPSIFSTTTDATDEQCSRIMYAVQENDTLQSIASQFSISTEAIITANHLTGNSVHASMILSIPLCGETPGTPRTATITFTPLLDPTTSTPVKGPTQ